MQWSNDTALEQELLSLKKAKLGLDSALANEKNERAKVTTEVAESKRKHKEDIFKLGQEQERAVAAEKALVRKTEEWKQSEVQKANALSTNVSLDKQLKAEQAEVKRLEYQLQSSAQSTSHIPSNNSKLVQESAALQRRVTELESDLSKAELALERERTASNARAAFGATQGSNPAAKVVALENQLAALKEENAKLIQAKTTSARTSITPADTRGRFGFGGGPSAIPARPGSSMGHNSQPPAPTGRRRSSSFSAIPSASSITPKDVHSPRLAQLELDLASTLKRADALDRDLAETKTKLATKERLLLQCENRLMALEKERKDEQKEAKADREEMRSELEYARKEAAGARKAAEVEQAGVLKGLREEKVSLSRQVERLTGEAERNRSLVERLEAKREELEVKVTARDDDLAAAKETIGTLTTDKRELEVALANQIENAADITELTRLENEVDSLGLALAAATAKAEQLEARDVVPRAEAQADAERLAQQLAAMRKERDSLSAAANALEAEWAEAKDVFDQQKADMVSWPVEREFLEGELGVKDSTIAGLEGKLNVQQGEHASVVAELAASHAVALADSAARADALEAAHSQAKAAVVAAEAQFAAASEERDALVAKQAAFDTAHSVLQATVTELEGKLADATEAHVQAVGQFVALEEAYNELQATADETHVGLAAMTETHRVTSAHLASSQSASAALAVVIATQETAHEELCADLAAAVDRYVHLDQKLADATNTLQEAHASQAITVETLEAQVHEALEHAAGLEAARSVDTEAAHDLRGQLAASQASFQALEQRVVDLTGDEINAQTSRAVAEHRIAELEDDVARLRGEVERLVEEASQTEEALAAATADGAEAEQRIDALEVEVTCEVTLREELQQRSAELGGQLAEAHDQLARVEAKVKFRDAGLDEARESEAQSVAAAIVASSKIDDLQYKLVATQVTLHEARQELSRLKEAVSTASIDLPQSPTRTPLSTDTTDPAPPDPATATPASQAPPAYDNLVRPAMLVQRLREERDLARIHLDFTRTEARFEVDALRDELRALGEDKADEMGELQSLLLQTGALMEAKVEECELVVERLSAAEKMVSQLEEELEALVAQSEDAESGQLQDLEELHAMLEHADERHNDLLTKIEDLEAELDQARIDRDRALVQAADAASPAFDDAAAGAEIARLEEEVDFLQGRVLRRTEAIGEREQAIAKLQQQLALAGVFDREDDDDDTVEIAVEPVVARAELGVQADLDVGDEELARELEVVKGQLADAQEEVVELRGELEASAIALGEAEARLAQLGKEADEARAAASAAEEALAALRGQHDVVVAEAAALGAGVAAAVAAKAEVEVELGARQAALASATEQLEAAQTAVTDLSVKLLDAQNEQIANSTAELERAARLEANVAAAQAGLEKMTGELAATQASLAEAETKAAALEADKAAAVDKAISLEEAKAALESAMAEHDARARLEMSRAAGLENSLAEQRQSFAELDAAHADLVQAHAATVAAHEADLDAVERDFGELQASLAEREAEVERLVGVVEEGERARGEVEGRLGAVKGELGEARRALVMLDSEAVTQHETQTERERELAQAREVIASLEEERAALHRQAEQAAFDRNALQADLAAAHHAQGTSASAQAQLDALQAQLEQGERTIAQLTEAVEAQRVHAREAKGAAEEAAKREIRQLRQMGLAADQAAQALQRECAELERMVQAAQGRVAQAEEGRARVEEELAGRAGAEQALEAVEREKAALESQVAVLSGELAEAREAAAGAAGSAADADRIRELEARVEAQAADVEETDEKYLAVLKQQKRQLGLIEKLKVKVEVLQRDLRNATAAAAAPSAPVIVATVSDVVGPAPAAVATTTTSPGASKKRSRADDPPAPTSATPRASVATLPKSLPRLAPASSPRAVDKENAASPAPGGKLAVRADGLVPLKPAAAGEAVRRVALGEVKPVLGGVQVVATGATGQSKTDELRARLAANRLGAKRPVA